MQSRDSTLSRQYVVGLSKLLDEKSNLQELKEICFNLNLDFENVPGDIKTEKAQGLASYFERRRNLSQLVLAIKEARPDIIIEPPPNEAQVSQKTEARRLYIAAISSTTTDKHSNIFFHLPWLSTLLGPTKVATPSGPARFVERENEAGQTPLAELTHQLNERDLILRSWQLAGIFTAQTGQLFTINSAFDINRDGTLTDRLNSTVGLVRYPVAGNNRIQMGLAPGVNAMSLLAPDGLDGAVGRNTFRAPKTLTFDLSVTKSIRLSENGKVLVRVEVFNLFNRANYGVPVRILESPGFGNSVSTTAPVRMVQLVLKYSF